MANSALLAHLEFDGLDFFRMFALLLLAIASGGMIRFYLSQSKMPWLAFLAVCSATVSMASTLIFKIVQVPDLGFRWWVAPPVILYSVFIIWSLRDFLRIRRS